MTNYANDRTAPGVQSVTSTSTNGTYVVGQTIPVSITFAENVYVTGTPQLTMETGSTDTIANYASGSGTNNLVFTYVVALNDASPDLDYQSAGALATNGGSVRDLAGNNATLTLPAPGAVGSLGSNKSIVIQTTLPTIAYSSVNPSSPGSSRTPTVSVTLSDASTVTLYSDNACTAAISSAKSLVGGAGQTITTYTLTSNAPTQIYGKAVAAFGNTSLCTSLVTYNHDDIAPTVNSFVRASGQNAFTNSTPISFTLTFSEALTSSTLTADDISNAGTATGVVWSLAASSSSVYTISATSSGNGTIIPRLAASAVTDPAGNANAAQADATDSVSYTAASYTVTLNQGVGQSDPINVLPINFTIVFSSAVGSSSFDLTDISQTGTADGITWTLASADQITWTLSATAVTTPSRAVSWPTPSLVVTATTP
jgi:hypothetical protein